LDESAQILEIEKDQVALNMLPNRASEKPAQRYGNRLTILKTANLGDQTYKL